LTFILLSKFILLNRIFISAQKYA